MAGKKNQKGRGKGGFTPRPMGGGNTPSPANPSISQGIESQPHENNALAALFGGGGVAPVPNAAANMTPVSARPAAATSKPSPKPKPMTPPPPPRSQEAMERDSNRLAEETSEIIRSGGGNEEVLEPMRRFLRENALLGVTNHNKAGHAVGPERPTDAIALVGTWTLTDRLDDGERTALLQEYIQDNNPKNNSEGMILRRLELMRSLAEDFEQTLVRSELAQHNYEKHLDEFVREYGLHKHDGPATVAPSRELFDMVRRLLPRTRMAYMSRLADWITADLHEKHQQENDEHAIEHAIEPLTAEEVSQPPFMLDPMRRGYTSLDVLVDGLEGSFGEDLGVMGFTVLTRRFEEGPLEKALVFCQFAAMTVAEGQQVPVLVFNRPLFAGEPLAYAHEKVYVYQMRLRWDERLDRAPAWVRMSLLAAQRTAQPDTHFSTQMMVVREKGADIPDQPANPVYPTKWVQLHTAMTFAEQSDVTYLYKDAPVFSLLRADGAYEGYHVYGAEGAAMALPTRPSLLHPYWKYMAEMTVKTQDERRYAMSSAVRANDPIVIIEREDGTQIPVSGFYTLWKAQQLGMTMVNTKTLTAGESAQYRIILHENEDAVDRPDMGPLTALLPQLRAHQMRGEAAERAKRLMAHARAHGGMSAATAPIRQELWNIMVSPEREIQPRLAVEIKDYLVTQAALAEGEGALMSPIIANCDLVLWTNAVYQGATRGSREAFTGYAVNFKEIKAQPQFWLYSKPRQTTDPVTGETLMEIGVLVYSVDALQKMISTPMRTTLRGLSRVSLLAPDITVSMEDPNMLRLSDAAVIKDGHPLQGGLDTEVYSALRFLLEPFVAQRQGELSKKFTERYQKEKKVNTVPSVSIIYLRRPEPSTATRKRTAPATAAATEGTNEDEGTRREISVSYIARGHWRRLESERFTKMRGEVVYVGPSLRGAGKPFKAGEGSIYLANR